MDPKVSRANPVSWVPFTGCERIVLSRTVDVIPLLTHARKPVRDQIICLLPHGSARALGTLTEPGTIERPVRGGSWSLASLYGHLWSSMAGFHVGLEEHKPLSYP